jgi:ubiquinone/menaquinone biosynthesis C-methylase UbiE
MSVPGLQAPLSQQSARVLESSPVHENQEAEEYDAMVRRYDWLLIQPFVDMVSRAGLRAGRVLDIGTGPGTVPVALARRHPAWEIWALDASVDMLERGRRHAAAADVAERVHFVPGSATDLPFTTGSFDLVISHFMVHHLDQPEAMLNEAARVVRGGGQVLIKDLCRPPRWKAALLLAFSRLVLGYTTEQLRLYRESLHAALTVQEARAALANSKLAPGEVRSFRGLDWVISSVGRESEEK